MSGARKTVIAEVRGVPYRLRVSLGAMDRIETVTGGTPFMQVVGCMASPATTRFGWVLAMFRAFAAAGGNPVDATVADSFEPSDMPEISNGVAEVLQASGLVEIETAADGDDSEGNADAAGAEETSQDPPRGESGSK